MLKYACFVNTWVWRIRFFFLFYLCVCVTVLYLKLNTLWKQFVPLLLLLLFLQYKRYALVLVSACAAEKCGQSSFCLSRCTMKLSKLGGSNYFDCSSINSIYHFQNIRFNRLKFFNLLYFYIFPFCAIFQVQFNNYYYYVCKSFHYKLHAGIYIFFLQFPFRSFSLFCWYLYLLPIRRLKKFLLYNIIIVELHSLKTYFSDYFHILLFLINK